MFELRDSFDNIFVKKCTLESRILSINFLKVYLLLNSISFSEINILSIFPWTRWPT